MSPRVYEYQTDEQGRLRETETASQEAESQLTQNLNGKAVVSITNGEKIGAVSDVMIDGESLQIAALVTSKGSLLHREFEAIPASAVMVWGKDVILVSGKDVIMHQEDLPDREKWITVSDRIQGRYVVSTDGTRIGQLNDVVIDPQGRIVAYDLSQVYVEGQLAESKRIPVSSTHSLGKDVLIVDTNR